MGIGHHVSEGRKSIYAVAHMQDTVVQIIENAPDCIHWLVVRAGGQEQKIALDLTALMVLIKAVSVHPLFKRLAEENKNG